MRLAVPWDHLKGDETKLSLVISHRNRALKITGGKLASNDTLPSVHFGEITVSTGLNGVGKIMSSKIPGGSTVFD